MEEKKRHGCVTAWLILGLVGGVFTVLVYLVFYGAIMEFLAEFSEDAMNQIAKLNNTMLGIVGILNVVFTIAVFKWKKWGFWGLVASSLVVAYMSYYDNAEISSVIGGLIGPLILYAILQIKRDSKTTWSQLD